MTKQNMIEKLHQECLDLVQDERLTMQRVLEHLDLIMRRQRIMAGVILGLVPNHLRGSTPFVAALEKWIQRGDEG